MFPLRELKLREVKKVAEGHAATEWQSQNLNANSRTLDVALCCPARKETEILILIFKEIPPSSLPGIQPQWRSLSSSNTPKAFISMILHVLFPLPGTLSFLNRYALPQPGCHCPKEPFPDLCRKASPWLQPLLELWLSRPDAATEVLAPAFVAARVCLPAALPAPRRGCNPSTQYNT